MNVPYDSEGIEYPIDDYGQVYVLFKLEQTGASVTEEENIKEPKNQKVLCQCGLCRCHKMLNWRTIVKNYKKLDGSCLVPP